MVAFAITCLTFGVFACSTFVLARHLPVCFFELSLHLAFVTLKVPFHPLQFSLFTSKVALLALELAFHLTHFVLETILHLAQHFVFFFCQLALCLLHLAFGFLHFFFNVAFFSLHPVLFTLEIPRHFFQVTFCFPFGSGQLVFHFLHFGCQCGGVLLCLYLTDILF